MKKRLVFHPFLFAVYPMLALLAWNINQTTLAQAQRVFGFTILVTILLLGVFYLLLKDWERAGLLVSLHVVLFFSHGHVIRFLSNIVPASFGLSQYDLGRYLTSLWAAIFIIGSWAIWRILKRDTQGITRALNVVAAAVLILPVSTIVFSIGRNMTVAANNQTKMVRTEQLPQDQLPDIYYIIMDGYARADVLEELYDYDNLEFLSFLTDSGFYVASNSHSNYAQTSLSLASSMNLEYVNYMTDRVGPNSEDRNPLTQLTQNSKVRKFLESHGYTVISFSSSYPASEFRDADVFYTPSTNMLNDFEVMLLSDTLPGAFFKIDLLFEMKRQRILYTFDTLKNVPATEEPTFVFAHIISPHLPFVFDENGEKVNPYRDYQMDGGLATGLTLNEYVKGYRGQLIYMNQLLEETIDEILTNSEEPPIIVLQGDHGSRALLDWGSIQNSCLKERMSILNAYYLPDGGSSQLYDSITPVNSFRVIFDTYFNTDLGLLEDESYFSLWFTPYDLVNVTDNIESSCKSKLDSGH
jgi:hypothetical protein